LVKETGIPTAPAEKGFSPDAQKDFYAELARQLAPSRLIAFAYFSAFDAPWRAYDETPVPVAHPEEAHWGLFTETRAPKPVLEAVPKLQLSVRRAALAMRLSAPARPAARLRRPS